LVLAAGFAATLAAAAEAAPVRAYCNTGSCSVNVPMTVSPNPAVVGQTIVMEINVGTYCAYGTPGFQFYAFHDNPMYTITLGSAGVGRFPPNIVYFHTNSLPAGVFRIHAYTQYCQPDQYDFYSVYVTEVSVTVKPRLAGPPATKQTPPQIKPNSPPPPVVIPTVHIQAFKLAPVPADFHTVAVIRTPSSPSVPGGGPLAVLVAAALAAVAIGALRRGRFRSGQ
jgi:hypothetical protein